MELNGLSIDGQQIKPVAVRSYEELLKIELHSSEVNQVFPEKSDTPRYQVSANGTPIGWYKVLSVKANANGKTTLLSLHRQ
jgi:hypothetical protein